jgi:hypothetical protein
VDQSQDSGRQGALPIGKGKSGRLERSDIEIGYGWIGPTVAALVALALLALSWDIPITDDVAWYLMATRDWLNGAALYQMIIEVNPPLNFYFTVPALFIADFLGVSDSNGQYILTALMVFGSLVWCGRIIRSDIGLSPARQAFLLGGIGFAMAMPALDSVGQREQGLVILMMPWLLGQLVPGTPNARTDVPRAFVAAFGVCLKPHFVLFPIAVTLVRMAQTKSLRPILSPANLTFLAVGMFYVCYVAVVHPAYLFDIAPMASHVYGAYKTDAGMLVAALYPRVLLVLFLLLYALRGSEVHRIPVMFAAVTLAGLACFLVQGTAFAYHQIPMSSFAMVACVLILAEARDFRPFIMAVAVTFVGFATLGLLQGYPDQPAVDQLDSVADEVGEFDSFISLSSSLFAGPPIAMATGAEWVSRYPANWLVPGAIEELGWADCSIEQERCATLNEIAARNRSDNIADMLRTEPDLLMVDLNSGFFPAPLFDWLAFMDEDPAWADVFRHYREVARTDRFRFFRRED